MAETCNNPITNALWPFWTNLVNYTYLSQAPWSLKNSNDQNNASSSSEKYPKPINRLTSPP